MKPAQRLFTFIILCLPLTAARAQDSFVLVNIGFKFGYAISDQSGLIGGIEVSMNYYGNGAGIGIFMSTEQWSGRELVHYGVQGFLGLVGASVGPTRMMTKSDTSTGVSFTVFGGAIAFPYYRFTTLRNGVDAHELGFYAKLPIPLVYPRYSLGG